MKLSGMITNYCANINLKAKLRQEITLNDGTVYPKGTISELLILLEDNRYHFEANHSACTVTLEEIEFI